MTKEEKEERTNPKFCQWCWSFIRRDSNWKCSKSIPCRHPYNHFTVGRLNQKWQNRTGSVCAEPLFVIPACEPKIDTKNSSISRLWLVEISDHMGPMDGSIFQRTKPCSQLYCSWKWEYLQTVLTLLLWKALDSVTVIEVPNNNSLLHYCCKPCLWYDDWPGLISQLFLCCSPQVRHKTSLFLLL